MCSRPVITFPSLPCYVFQRQQDSDPVYVSGRLRTDGKNGYEAPPYLRLRRA